MKVLSTKELSGETLQWAGDHGLDIDCVQLIETRKREFDLSKLTRHFDAYIFTSPQAVDYFFEKPEAQKLIANKPVYCLAGKTNDTLQLYGIDPLMTGDDADWLSQLICATASIKIALHITGSMRLNVLQKKLEQSGKRYDVLEVYDTILKQPVAIGGPYEAIMFYSPSGIDAYCLNAELKPEPVYVCIGETTAAALRNKSVLLKVLAANYPEADSMLDTLIDYFKSAHKL